MLYSFRWCISYLKLSSLLLGLNYWLSSFHCLTVFLKTRFALGMGLLLITVRMQTCFMFRTGFPYGVSDYVEMFQSVSLNI